LFHILKNRDRPGADQGESGCCLSLVVRAIG
jgi:hypothetical protein